MSSHGTKLIPIFFRNFLAEVIVSRMVYETTSRLNLRSRHKLPSALCAGRSTKLTRDTTHIILNRRRYRRLAHWCESPFDRSRTSRLLRFIWRAIKIQSPNKNFIATRTYFVISVWHKLDSPIFRQTNADDTRAPYLAIRYCSEFNIKYLYFDSFSKHWMGLQFLIIN